MFFDEIPFLIARHSFPEHIAKKVYLCIAGGYDVLCHHFVMTLDMNAGFFVSIGHNLTHSLSALWGFCPMNLSLVSFHFVPPFLTDLKLLLFKLGFQPQNGGHSNGKFCP